MRNIRRIGAALAVSALTLVGLAAPAEAAKPFILNEGSFDVTFYEPFVCDPAVILEINIVGSFRTTVFFDKNGDTRLLQDRAHGTTTYTPTEGEGPSATEHWSNTAFVELAPGSIPGGPNLGVTVVGNRTNIHSDDGGKIAVNDSGRVVFDADGNVISLSGPAQGLTGDLSFCDDI
ncbi:MAG: hypothetical protein ACN4GZ_17915 [Acidimicrobiales bacterium]